MPAKMRPDRRGRSAGVTAVIAVLTPTIISHAPPTPATSRQAENQARPRNPAQATRLKVVSQSIGTTRPRATDRGATRAPAAPIR